MGRRTALSPAPGTFAGTRRLFSLSQTRGAPRRRSRAAETSRRRARTFAKKKKKQDNNKQHTARDTMQTV